MKFYKLLLYSFLLLFLATGCHDDDNEPIDGPETADAYTQRVNNFIYQVMKSCYLWTDQIPELDRQYETDPKAYFHKLLVEEDVYSGITDNLQELLNSFKGIEKAFGYALAYTWADKSQSKVWGVVEYVYPNTPASKAGIKRGDLIGSLNGKDITPSNMNELITSQNITIGIGTYQNGSYIASKTVSLAMAVIEQNPVHTHKIIDAGAKKVGYLFYTSYIENFNSSLDLAFAEFKNAGVSELILDLRYNLGGDENAIVNLCSHIAPVTACKNRELIIEKKIQRPANRIQ